MFTRGCIYIYIPICCLFLFGPGLRKIFWPVDRDIPQYIGLYNPLSSPRVFEHCLKLVDAVQQSIPPVDSIPAGPGRNFPCMKSLCHRGKGPLKGRSCIGCGSEKLGKPPRESG